MPCVVCGNSDENTKYKCPKCSSKYCSVKCYKEHKSSCSSNESADVRANQSRSSTQLLGPEVEQHSEFQRIYENEEVQELLRCEGVEQHLRLIFKILEDPALSGEQNQEGRKIVALKKIRELRKGGREANSAIEDLALKVIQLFNAEHGETV